MPYTYLVISVLYPLYPRSCILVCTSRWIPILFSLDPLLVPRSTPLCLPTFRPDCSCPYSRKGSHREPVSEAAVYSTCRLGLSLDSANRYLRPFQDPLSPSTPTHHFRLSCHFPTCVRTARLIPASSALKPPQPIWCVSVRRPTDWSKVC